MSFRTTLAAVGLAAGLVLAPLASPATSHAAPDVDVVAAADWLSGQFTDNQYLKGFDGSTPDPATTIDGVLALVAADAHPELVASTVTWLGGQAGELASTPTSAARAAILAEAVGQDAANFGGVNLVTAMQGDLGDAASNPYGLALLVIGLERTDTQVPAAVVDALLATQQDDGAFAFPDFGVDIDSTALAAQALSLLDDNERAGLAQRKAVGWLIDNQCTETSELCPTTGPYWGSYSPANTAGLAIAALRLAGEDTTDQLTWLYAQQEADGGFPAAIGAGYSDVYATAQSLVAVTGSDLTSVGEDAEESEGAGRDNSARFLLGGLGMLLALVVVLAVYRMRRSES